MMKEVDNKKTILIDSLDQIDTQKEVSKNQSKINEKYYSFFENSPFALWIKDFSFAKSYIETLTKESKTTVKSYIANNPSVIEKLISLVIIKEVNATAVSLYKAKSKEDLQKNALSICTTTSDVGFSKLLIEILSGKKESSIKSVHKTFDGGEINVLIKIDVEDGSQTTLNNVVVSIENITETVRSEKKLNTTKNLFSNTLSGIKGGFVMVDYNSNYLYINQEAADLLNIKSIQDLIGKNLWTEFPEKEGDTFFDYYQKALETRKPVSFENYFEPWNRWFENRIVPSNEGMLLFFQDITDEKIAENKIQEAYNIINKSSSVAILCKNVRGLPFEFVSENALDLFGYTNLEFLSNEIKFFELVHPEDLGFIKAAFIKLRNGKQAKSFKPESFRIITKKGGIKWIRSSVDIIKNKQNKITHIQGIVEDITEQKKTEDLFFESSQRLKSQFNNTPLASIIWDLDYKILDWNDSAERIFGYKAAEVIGIKNRDLLTPPHLISKMENLRETVFTQKESLKNTNENITKNGDIITCDWYSVTLKDAQNNIIGSACLIDDITERIETGKLLFNSNQRLKDQFNNTPLASIIWDLDFNVVEWNNSAHRIFGFTEKEAKEKPIKDLLTPEYLTADMGKVLEKLLIQKEGFKNTNENVTKSGRLITCDWYNVALKDTVGNVTGMASLVDDITERINTEIIIEKSEKKYRDIFEKTIDAVLILKDGMFIDCNESTLKMFGYPSKQLFLKMDPSRISPETQASGESSFMKSKRMMNIALEKGNNRFRWDHKQSNGHVFPAEVSLARIDENDKKPTIHVVIKDISERVKNEALEDVLYNISKAALTINKFKDFNLLVKNELHKIIDTSNFYIGLCNEDADIIKTPFMVDEIEVVKEFPSKNTLTGYVIKTKKPLMVNNASHRMLIAEGKVGLVGVETKIWLGVPLKIKDKVFGAIVVQSYTNENAYNENDINLLEFVADQISTIIQRKKAENELKMALTKARESDKLKSSFLANMSHEIRTPMNGIIGFSELFLEQDLSDNERRKYAEIVIDSSKQLLSIVNDILDISKIEAGVVKLNYESINLNDLLDGLNAFYKPRAEESNLKLSCIKGLGNIDSIIEMDKTKLNQVLTNLLSNAFKFTDEGSIEFGYQLTENKLQFYVKDTGIGIEESLQHKIFDRFIQANIDLSKKLQGTGLGLSISKKFIELFKGEIWLESSSEGSTIYFTIPYVKSQTPILATVVDNQNQYIKVKDKELTILVAEDEEYNMMYINELFSKTKFKIIQADNGKSAVELSQKYLEIDLILMDIKMPIMDGHKAMTEIKKKRPLLPIIALSAFAMESDKKTALKNGFDAYLTKPIDKKLLFNMIGKYVD